jgi:GNAT superfamily N-acetyltransferase
LRREVTPTVVRHTATADGGEGVIIYSQLTEANVVVEIRRQAAYFQRIGQEFEWKVYDYDRPADLKERLAFHGFSVAEAEALMVLDLDMAPEILWRPVDHDVQRIVSPEGLNDVQLVESAAWDEDASWVDDYLGGTLRDHPELMSVYVAYLDGQPASAGWTYYPKGSQFASLWGGATISQFRRQGLYTAILAARAQEARARGVRFLTVDASPMSRPILEKFGFEFIAYSYACKWSC